MVIDKTQFRFCEHIREEENKIIVAIPRESVESSSKFRLEVLKTPEPLFFQCVGFNETDHSFQLHYEKNEEFQSFKDIDKKTQLEKLLLLINVGDYFKGSGKKLFNTTFSPSNVYFSDTYDIMFAYRSISGILPPGNSPLDELDEYKSLILSSLQTKYTFERLREVGNSSLDKDPLFGKITAAKNIAEIISILKKRYHELYKSISKERIAFNKKSVLITTSVSVGLFVLLLSFLAFYAYTALVQTAKYKSGLEIYESYFRRDSASVIQEAGNLDEKDMSETLKRVVADALLTSDDKEALERAFYLDSTIQVDVILKLVELGETSTIAGLRSDKLKPQLFQAFYAEDYDRVELLATTNVELLHDVQAQVLLAKAYMKQNNYEKAAETVEGLRDNGLQIEVYETYREYVINNEQDLSRRTLLLDNINKVLEELKKIEEAANNS